MKHSLEIIPGGNVLSLKDKTFCLKSATVFLTFIVFEPVAGVCPARRYDQTLGLGF